ncbi:MAG: hypothetical protein WC284_19060 [Candidimonas sp.]
MDDFTRRRLYELKPLTDAELRALWAACPTPAMREALWEIRRLHSRLAYINDKAAMAAGGDTDALSSLHYFVAQIAEEPGVQTIVAADVRREWRMFHQGHIGYPEPSDDDAEVTQDWLRKKLREKYRQP